MVAEQKSNLTILGIFPKCPFYSSVQAVLIILVLIALGTWGIYFLNVGVAIAYLLYSLVYYFLAMPFVLCKYCYYQYKETTIDSKTGETIKQLVPLDQYNKSYLPLHVKHGKRWTWMMSIIWLLPIVLIGISFFVSFSIYALIALLGFIGVLVGNVFYMLKKKCPTCAIQEGCHSGFKP